MLNRLQDFWTYHRRVFLAFLVMLGLTGFFGVKSISQFIYWADPQHQDQPLANWMTPRYVGQSYQVPPDVIFAAFDLAPDGAKRRVSLATLAAEKGVTLQQLQSQVDAAVGAWRAENPRPRE